MNLTWEEEDSQRYKFTKFKTIADFLCDKECGYYTCKGCEFFYKDQEMNLPRCLKRNVRDWVLHHMEENKETHIREVEK